MGNLKLTKKDATTLELNISVLFRLCCLFFAAAITAGAVISGRFALVPAIVTLISLTGGLYREKWVFSTSRREVESTFGAGPFVKKETIPFEQIERFEITHFVKGQSDIAVTKRRPGRSDGKVYITFSVVLINKDPETGTSPRRDIEIIPERTSAGRTEKNARAIAAFCGKNLTVDR